MGLSQVRSSLEKQSNQVRLTELSLFSSDPSSFSIYLVNMSGYPNVHKLVAENVKTSDGSYTLDGVSGVDNG